MSFDATFDKPDRNAATAFAVLRAQHAFVTNYAVTAAAGKLLQAQVTITRSSPPSSHQLERRSRLRFQTSPHPPLGRAAHRFAEIQSLIA
jgi:hypothetical protein